MESRGAEFFQSLSRARSLVDVNIAAGIYLTGEPKPEPRWRHLGLVAATAIVLGAASMLAALTLITPDHLADHWMSATLH